MEIFANGAKNNAPYRSKRQCTDLFLCLCFVLTFSLQASMAFAQSSQSKEPHHSEPDDAKITSASNGRGYTVHVTTREVVVEVVARGHDNHPVNDLAAADFEIFEGARKQSASSRRISGFRVIDPDLSDSASSADNFATVLPLGGRCEIRSTVHYELAFHPQNWTSGIHIIRVATTRHHVTLSYRTQFYVGISDVPGPSLPDSEGKKITDLRDAACYHSDVPPSIPLLVTLAADASRSTPTYDLIIGPDSLTLAGIDPSSNHLELEYGVCTFSRSGRATGFWKARLDRTVTSDELTNILDKGLQERIAIPRKERPALARLVVLEPRSGNLGIVDLAMTARSARDLPSSKSSRSDSIVFSKFDERPRVGSEISLGSVVPAPEAFCGDVYELPSSTTLLPNDFRALNSLGSVFTDAFNVAEQALQQGLPGSTPRTEWFGVDYYGEFWVNDPGKYEFVLTADDGADLYIDDRKIIGEDGIHPPQTGTGSVKLDAGRHTIHLPYFEGPKYVSLILEVKPPNGSLTIFDMRDYARLSAAGK